MCQIHAINMLILDGIYVFWNSFYFRNSNELSENPRFEFIPREERYPAESDC